MPDPRRICDSSAWRQAEAAASAEPCPAILRLQRGCDLLGVGFSPLSTPAGSFRRQQARLEVPCESSSLGIVSDASSRVGQAGPDPTPLGALVL